MTDKETGDTVLTIWCPPNMRHRSGYRNGGLISYEDWIAIEMEALRKAGRKVYKASDATGNVAIMEVKNEVAG